MAGDAEEGQAVVGGGAQVEDRLEDGSEEKMKKEEVIIFKSLKINKKRLKIKADFDFYFYFHPASLLIWFLGSISISTLSVVPRRSQNFNKKP